MSGFHEDDKLTPVITIMVYLGSRPWEIEDFSRFKTSLGAVFEVIKASEDKEAMKRLLAMNPQYRSMDNE